MPCVRFLVSASAAILTAGGIFTSKPVPSHFSSVIQGSTQCRAVTKSPSSVRKHVPEAGTSSATASSTSCHGTPATAVSCTRYTESTVMR